MIEIQQHLKTTFVNKANASFPFTIPSSKKSKQIFSPHWEWRIMIKIIWLKTKFVTYRNELWQCAQSHRELLTSGKARGEAEKSLLSGRALCSRETENVRKLTRETIARDKHKCFKLQIVIWYLFSPIGQSMQPGVSRMYSVRS